VWIESAWTQLRLSHWITAMDVGTEQYLRRCLLGGLHSPKLSPAELKASDRWKGSSHHGGACPTKHTKRHA